MHLPFIHLHREAFFQAVRQNGFYFLFLQTKSILKWKKTI